MAIKSFKWGPCIEFAVYGRVQISTCGQRRTRAFFYGKRLKKCMRLHFLLRNISGHTAVVAPTLRLRSTAQNQKLKDKVKSLK